VTSEGSASDEALVLRAKRGERDAFDLLIHNHKGALYRLVRRYVGNADDAYDILQETWISAWEALTRFDTQRPFLAWVRVIALNKCRDFTRRGRFRRLVLQAFSSEPSTAIAAPGTPEQLERENTIAMQERRLIQLDAAIAALPTLYKEPIVLTTAGGLSQEEAAAVLKTTPKAIEMRLRRARRKLTEAIDRG
jgi:RNA polymerase sigma factor (sigma-70 family)